MADMRCVSVTEFRVPNQGREPYLTARTVLSMLAGFLEVGVTRLYLFLPRHAGSSAGAWHCRMRRSWCGWRLQRS